MTGWPPQRATSDPLRLHDPLWAGDPGFDRAVVTGFDYAVLTGFGYAVVTGFDYAFVTGFGNAPPPAAVTGFPASKFSKGVT